MQDISESTLAEDAPLLKKPQVAAYFGVTVRTIELWMSAGHIPYFKIGRNVRFRMADILEHLREQKRIG